MRRTGAHWPNASIHTVGELRKRNRRADRMRTGAAQTLDAMKNGAALLMFYEQGRPVWKLSTGIFITPDVANAVTNNPNVVGVGDCLFPGAGASQTYRWVNNQEDQT